MRKFKRLCVFCGTGEGNHPAYLQAAQDLGTYLAQEGIAIVYGGGRIGLMGALANGALQASGQVIGVIPERLKALELSHETLTELFVVDSMHARKAMMAHLSDAFIALPGGWGTLEEVFEVTTWTQLNYHRKPVGLLNVRNYFDRLLEFIEHAAGTGFIRPIHQGLMLASDSPSRLLSALENAEIPELRQWITKP